MAIYGKHLLQVLTMLETKWTSLQYEVRVLQEDIDIKYTESYVKYHIPMETIEILESVLPPTLISNMYRLEPAVPLPPPSRNRKRMREPSAARTTVSQLPQFYDVPGMQNIFGFLPPQDRFSFLRTNPRIQLHMRTLLQAVKRINVNHYQEQFEQICSRNFADRVRSIALVHSTNEPTIPEPQSVFIPQRRPTQKRLTTELQKNATSETGYPKCVGWDDLLHLESVHVDLSAFAKLHVQNHAHFMSVFNMPGIREVRLSFGINPNQKGLDYILQRLASHVQVLSLPMIVTSPIATTAWSYLFNRRELCVPLGVYFTKEICPDSLASVAIARRGTF